MLFASCIIFKFAAKWWNAQIIQDLNYCKWTWRVAQSSYYGVTGHHCLETELPDALQGFFQTCIYCLSFIQAMYISKRFRPSVYTPTFIWSRYWKTREAKPTCLYLYSSGLYVRYVRHICVKTEYSAVILFYYYHYFFKTGTVISIQ